MCPKCGKTHQREMRICPECFGEPVCNSCCLACDDFDIKAGWRCRYSEKHPKIDYDREIRKKQNLIETYKEKICHFYERSMPKVALTYEIKLSMTTRELRELEEKREESIKEEKEEKRRWLELQIEKDLLHL